MTESTGTRGARGSTGTDLLLPALEEQGEHGDGSYASGTL
jgi:hypothetical protein